MGDSPDRAVMAWVRRLPAMAAVVLLALRVALGVAGAPPPKAGHDAHAGHHAGHHAGQQGAPADPRPDGDAHDGHGVCHLCRSADVAVPLPASSPVVRPSIVAVVVWPVPRPVDPRRPVFRTSVQPRAPPGFPLV